MTIHVYISAWNDEFMLPHALAHYEKFADKIFVIDRDSTDKTAEIAKAHPKVTYIKDKHPYDEKHISESFVRLAKENMSDWAVCVDCDEFIEWLVHLQHEPKGIIKATGWMMLSKTGKLEDCDMVRMETFDKPVIFDPKLDIKFGDGRHTVNLPTRASVPGGHVFDYPLLHYKYISREYYLQRVLDTYPRMMDAEQMSYRIKRGLAWYDRHIV